MNNQKVMQFLFIIVPVLFVLSIWSNAFGPFLSVAFVFLIILVSRSIWAKNLFTKQRSPTVYYQPTQPASQTSQQQEPPPRANPPLGFDLTAQEYQQLSKQYQQGYQAKTSRPTKKSAMPKEPSVWDYEQPQAQYPEQEPPVM
jgi:hypothetical protein